MATEEMSEQDMKQEAFTLLAQGKRHLLVKDYFEATTSLALACEYLARVFGESADECGDAYFTYGKALLELARTETGVLGNAIEEKDEQEDEDSEEDNAEAAAGSTGDNVTEPEGAEDKANTPNDSEKEADKPAESTTEISNTAEIDSSVKESDAVDNVTDKSETSDKHVTSTSAQLDNVEPGPSVASSSKENGHAENGSDADADGDAADGSDEDDVSNLHLAWEVLEIAKNIFTRRAEAGEQSHQLRLAEVQLALGEVAMESENYTDATADMSLCLELQKKHLADDDRRIAETLYQMGVAYSLANSFDEAISSFSECGHVLERRVAGLRRRIEAGDAPPGDDPFYTFQGEVEQLEKLFPEIREKIFDMQDFKQETMRALAGGGDPGAGSSKGAGSSIDGAGSSNDKPAAPIGHLVRKKSKPEEPDAKRARIDDGDQK